MDILISPKYQLKLVEKVEKAIWAEFSSYKRVLIYIQKWHYTEPDINYTIENFSINYKESGDIDLFSTLHTMDGETLVKIAIDLGVETPDFIPAIPNFREAIKSEYSTASATFEKALKQIEEHPDIAVGLANSALESIIKEILKDERIQSKVNKKKTLYDLTTDILKVFKMFPNSELPEEIKIIGSSLLSINQGIEKLRSEKTNMHGKTGEDYIINDSLYTHFVVNSVTTVGLFLDTYYRKKIPKPENSEANDEYEDLPF